MDTNEKLMSLMEMLDNPEKYTERQFEKILGDDECRRYYETMAALRDACGRKSANYTDDKMEDKTDEEWRRFERTHYKKRKLFNLQKIAATIAIAAIISGMSYATLLVIGKDSRRETTGHRTTAITTTENDTATTTVPTATTAGKEIITYDNVALDSILNDIATYHGLGIHYNNEQAKSLRLFFQWNPQEPPQQVIKSLNSFERVSIRMDEKTLTVE